MTDSTSTCGTNTATRDVHVCGSCQAEYRSLDTFLAHKESCSPPSDVGPVSRPASPTDTSPQPTSDCSAFHVIFTEVQQQYFLLLQMLQKLFQKITENHSGCCSHQSVTSSTRTEPQSSWLHTGSLERNCGVKTDLICPVDRQKFSDLKAFLDHLQHHEVSVIFYQVCHLVPTTLSSELADAGKFVSIF